MNQVPSSTCKKVYDYSSGFRCSLFTTVIVFGSALIATIILSIIDCGCYSDRICGALIACIFIFWAIIALGIVGICTAIAAIITYCNASSQLDNLQIFRLNQYMQQQQVFYPPANNQPYVPPPQINDTSYNQI